MDEIYGPTRIRPGLDEQRCSRANGTLATTTLANCQTFFSIEALRLLAVHDMQLKADGGGAFVRATLRPRVRIAGDCNAEHVFGDGERLGLADLTAGH